MSKNPFEEGSKKASPELLAAVERMKVAQGGKRLENDERKRLIEGIINSLRVEFEEMGGVYYDDINKMVKALDGVFVVRREDPERIIKTLKLRDPIHLQVDPNVGELYANSVEWMRSQGQRGIENAFLEGHGDLGSLVTVAGYSPTHLNIRTVPNAARPGQGVDRTLVRCATGTIQPEDVRFLMVRVPAKAFPEDQLTEQEVEKLDDLKPEQAQRVPILRGFIFPATKTSQHAAE